LAELLRQSVFRRLAGYEEANDAEKLCRDLAMRFSIPRLPTRFMAAGAVSPQSNFLAAHLNGMDYNPKMLGNLANVGVGAGQCVGISFLGRLLPCYSRSWRYPHRLE
jgi:hypothetical protein